MPPYPQLAVLSRLTPPHQSRHGAPVPGRLVPVLPHNPRARIVIKHLFSERDIDKLKADHHGS